MTGATQHAHRLRKEGENTGLEGKMGQATRLSSKEMLQYNKAKAHTAKKLAQ